MPGKCVFNQLWLKNKDYLWVESVPGDKHRARCKVCAKDIDIGKMGESALKSHMKAQRHLKYFDASMTTVPVKDFFGKETLKDPVVPGREKERGPIVPEQESMKTPVPGKEISITSHLTRPELLNYEIKWALKCVESHYSMNSCEGINYLFQEMFEDSDIAKQFSCGPTKCAYLIRFGLAPYFKLNLYKYINELDFFTVLFDESLNHSTQSKQMDIHIRFWDVNHNIIKTRFYASAFLGHSTANDTLKALLGGLEKLNLSNMLNLSMDGPAVNWKVYNLLQELLKNDFNNSLLNVGSCALHIVNNCFKDGCNASDWDIDGILASLYYLFKDCPARREDFLENSKSSLLPKKFCRHRWLENAPTAERAIEMWEDVLSYVQAVEKKTYTKPTSKSYKVIANAVKDNLMPIKLNCFLAAAKIIQPFLIRYQNDSPLLPLLAEDLKQIALDCLRTFSVIKTENLNELKTSYKLCSFDFEDKTSYSCMSKVSLGFVGDKLLKRLTSQKKVTEREIRDLKHETQSFIYTMVKNLVAKSPLKFAMVRNLCCLDPRRIAQNRSDCYTKMKRILLALAESKKVKDEECDTILLQFNEFINDTSDDKLIFDPLETRLDKFYYKLLGSEQKYQKLWNVIKLLLVLSHGQATVERGFSQNKQLEVENLNEETYVAKRIVLDEIKNCGGLRNVVITKELRIAAAGARQKYLAHLEEQKKRKLDIVETKKRKGFMDELEELKAKKARLQNSADELEKSADALADKAEKTECVKFITQSNSFRRTAKEKIVEMKQIDIKINSMLDELKKIK